MRDTVLEWSVDLDAPPADVYAFHLDTRSAPRISPPDTRFLAIDGAFPVAEGALVRLRVRQPPIPVAQEWLVRIAELVPDRLVVDEAVRSPFARWRQEHRFDPLANGGTRMTDRVAYRLPLGPLGRLVAGAAVARRLEAVFAERHRRTAVHFARREGA